ncbi:MAG: PAS domain S-box protein [Rhodospirillaceae bacterium]
MNVTQDMIMRQTCLSIRHQGVAASHDEERYVEPETEAAAQLGIILSYSEDAIVSKSLDGIVRSWNKGAERMFGYRAEEMIGQSITKIFPDDHLHEEAMIVSELIRGRRVPAFNATRLTKNNELIHISVSVAPIVAADGTVIGGCKIARDVTEQRRIEAQARVFAERFNLAAKATNDLMWDWDHASGEVWVNEAFAVMFGCEPGRQRSGRIDQWIAHVHPDDRKKIAKQFADSMQASRSNWSAEFRVVTAAGSVAIVNHRQYLIRSENGQPQRLLASITDVTQQRELEERLRQGQKLEAIGQLTGGVAHDFNNLLTVILGNVELLRDGVAGRTDLCVLVDLMERAARRGAELSQRLLAVSRKQSLHPRILDVNKLIASMEALLRRTLGEGIEIELVRGGGLWNAIIDEGQLEVALLNLAVNARDAMPNGGRLVIETANVALDDRYAAADLGVAPGQYVMLCVSDSGVGMSKETLENAFEPFFTTKDVGKGTGLGLSMVYGFMKQSGGHVKIYSELGLGTTVKLFVPRARSAAGIVDKILERNRQIPQGSERILLVEDDDLVRQHTKAQLSSLGYSVVAASNGADALNLLKTEVAFDLLLMDVVLPKGMNGKVLAQEGKKLRPNLPVLYTSGYTGNVIIGSGQLGPDVKLLSKPFGLEELATNVRAALAVHP